jgi:hypothetical protein
VKGGGLLFLSFWLRLAEVFNLSQNRHPERSASQLYRVTDAELRGVEGPRRRSLANALPSFLTAGLVLAGSARNSTCARPCQVRASVLEKLRAVSAEKHRRGPSTPRNEMSLCDRAARRSAQDDGLGRVGKNPSELIATPRAAPAWDPPKMRAWPAAMKPPPPDLRITGS